MKPRLSHKIFGPFIIKLFKGFWHPGVVRSMRDCNRGLNKKLVFEKFKVITYSIGVKDLKTSIDFSTTIIHNRLPRRHDMNILV